MDTLRKLIVFATVLTVVFGVVPSSAAADEINPPGDWTEGFDISDNGASDTDLNTGLIDYSGENETFFFRTTHGDNPNLNSDEAVLIYIDADQDLDTGINRNTVTDGEAGSTYYSNLDNIGADYVVSAGGELGNSTYEWTGATWSPVATNQVNVTDGNVTVEIDETDINSPGQFALKFAYLEGDTSSSSNYDWAPNPSNDRFRSIPFDTAIDGIPDLEPEATVSGEINATDSLTNDLEVEVRLTDDSGAEVAASPKTFLITKKGTDGAETYNFRGLNPDNFNGNGQVEAEITNESTAFRLTPKGPQSIGGLSDGEFLQQPFDLTKDDPPIELTVEPESGYFEAGETVNATINLTNYDDVEVSQVVHTLEYDTSKISIDDIDEDTDASDSILAQGNGYTFDPEPIDTGIQTAIGTQSESGSTSNGTLYNVTFTLAEDATDYQVQDTVTISQDTNTLLNSTGSEFASEVVAENTNKTINQTETNISGVSAQIATKGGNMVNSTMIVTASAATNNGGKFENITITNTTSGTTLATADCENEDVDCQDGVELDVFLGPGNETFNNQTINTYASQEFTVKAYGNHTDGTDSVRNTTVSDRILKEGDITLANEEPGIGNVGNVTRSDVVDLVNSEYFRQNVGDPTEWEDRAALIYDTNNDGVVDLQDVLTVIRASY